MMPYSQKEIKLIQEKRPDLRFQRIPTLDDIILEFLKKFDIIFTKELLIKDLKILNDKKNIETNFFKEVKSHNTLIETEQVKYSNEWQFWRNWALDHKDFESFRISRIKKNQIFNKLILEKLNSEEVKKDFSRYFKKSAKNHKFEINHKIFNKLYLIIIFIIPVIIYLKYNNKYIESKSTEMSDVNIYYFQKI